MHFPSRMTFRMSKWTPLTHWSVDIVNYLVASIFPPLTFTCEQCQKARVTIISRQQIPKNLCYIVRLFMCGVLILWVHFFFHLVLYTYLVCCWLCFYVGKGYCTRTNDAQRLMTLQLLGILLGIIFFTGLKCLKQSLVIRGLTSITGPWRHY